MITPVKMAYMFAVTFPKYSEAVTLKLLDLGVLEFIDTKEISEKWEQHLNVVGSPVPPERISEIKKGIASLLEIIDLNPQENFLPDLKNFTHIRVEETERLLEKISASLEEVDLKRDAIKKELVKLRKMHDEAEYFKNISVIPETNKPYSFIVMKIGKFNLSKKRELEAELEKITGVLISSSPPGEKALGSDYGISMVIALKKYQDELNRILERYDWKPVTAVKNINLNRPNLLFDLAEKIEKRKKELDKLDSRYRAVVEERRDNLVDIWQRLSIDELYLRIQSNFGTTKRTVEFSGWLPEEYRKAVESALKKVTGGNIYIEWYSPERVKRELGRQLEAPVEMKNPALFKPFQMLVKSYDIPKYGTIDPTPLVALSYLSMFGLMFADVGQGFVILLAGVWGLLLGKKSAKKDRSSLFGLLAWCGVAAIVTGVLFGSYFGFQLFPPLWFNYHGVIAGETTLGSPVRSVYDILTITIYFGITIIAIGLLLNWVNLILRREWLELILSKGGLVGGWLYGTGVYVAYYLVNHGYRELLPASILLPMVGLPLILLFFKSPIEYFRKSREERKENRAEARKHFSPFLLVNFFMDWMVEMLEIFTGYLANTLSFMRVAGLGIAHVSLLIAFFSIAKMTASNGHFTVSSYLILITGNILIILLEGLSAGVQALRLNYYEFFSKYFIGNGKAYEPISLRSLGRDRNQGNPKGEKLGVT